MIDGLLSQTNELIQSCDKLTKSIKTSEQESVKKVNNKKKMNICTSEIIGEKFDLQKL